MNKSLSLLSLLLLPLIVSAEVPLPVELLQMESACSRWADMEQVKGEAREYFVSECVAGLELELEQTGSIDLD